MNILVLGGTYFLGKSFVNLSSKTHQLTLINRGNRKVSFENSENIIEIKADRHNLSKGQFLNEKFDVVVDFCAYREGDIRGIVEAIGNNISKYIFISTVDVYKRGVGKVVDEDGEFETENYGSEAGEYILGKVALEKEIKRLSEDCGFSYVSIRPGFIYGPDSYAAREDIFFNWIEKAGQILYPENSDGVFYMAYVDDVAKAVLKAVETDSVNNSGVNILGEKSTYESFSDALKYATSIPFEKVTLPIDEINSRQIPLPYPLTEKESEQYTTKYSDFMSTEYTTLKQGLKNTYIYRMDKEIFLTIDTLFDENRPKDAEAYMISMLKATEEDSMVMTRLKLLNELIGYYRQTSEKIKLINVINDALDIAEDTKMSATVECGTTMLNVANAYRSLNDLENAESFYNRAIEKYDRLIKIGKLSADDMLLAGLHNNISLYYQEINDYKSAKNHLLKALEIVTSNNAGFEIAVTYANLANTSLLVHEYEDGEKYARKAIRLFKERGLKDPHYCAALSALATIYFENGNINMAKKIFTEAMNIVEGTIGKNSQYNRLKESVEQCSLSQDDLFIKGLDLARMYYEEYGKSMISEKFAKYENKIAVGLCGEGSDCYGYDDEFSKDHDYGPDFCMFVSDDVYDEIGEKLQEEYNALPLEYHNVKRITTGTGQGRRGVIKISDYFRKFTGTDDVRKIDYPAVEDYALAACVNGEIFRDDEGIFSEKRNIIKQGYPARVRLLKIANEAALFSQYGQYNYLRMLKREDEFSAGMMLSDALKHAIKLYHYIENVYPPHDKWLFNSLKNLPGSDKLVILAEKAQNKFATDDHRMDVAAVFEEMGAYFAEKLYELGDISDIDSYIDHHTGELLFKADIVSLSKDELVEKVVRLEFEAFDKVKNEGGRAYCQNDWPTFSVMRKSQYLTWDNEMLIQYLYDFTREYKQGHNLITEKYGRMMESTAPERYEEIKGEFPEISDEKKGVIEQIVGIQMNMMEEFAKDHPKVASNARSLHTYEDSIINTSYETYLRGEISTYSDKMLQLYGRYVILAVKEGKNIAFNTMENTAKLYGYANLHEFEASITDK